MYIHWFLAKFVTLMEFLKTLLHKLVWDWSCRPHHTAPPLFNVGEISEGQKSNLSMGTCKRQQRALVSGHKSYLAGSKASTHIVPLISIF